MLKHYSEGRQANIVGIALLCCPLPRLSMAWQMWRLGWVDSFMEGM